MTIKAIIPCAGYGSRMGMGLFDAKEMLPDPNNQSKFLIDYSLDLCYKYKIDPVVITRLEKKTLIEYILNNHPNAELIITSPGKEWAETVLKSRGLWGEKNILILPDTRFNEDAIPSILHELNYNQVVAAVHKINPEDSDKWGTVVNDGIHEKVSNHEMYAWGLLGWEDQAIGLNLFSKMNPGGSWYAWNNIGKVELDSFQDITRSGTLEKY